MNTIRSSLLAALLAAAPAGALACTGSSADPVHCINNNQAINGFGEFYSRNLQPLSTQNPDDASDFAQPTWNDIAPRVGALSGGLLHSNYALYADLEGATSETEVPLGTGLEPVWFVSDWFSTHTEVGVAMSPIAADLRGQLSVGLGRDAQLDVIMGLDVGADGSAVKLGDSAGPGGMVFWFK